MLRQTKEKPVPKQPDGHTVLTNSGPVCHKACRNEYKAVRNALVIHLVIHLCRSVSAYLQPLFLSHLCMHFCPVLAPQRELPDLNPLKFDVLVPSCVPCCIPNTCGSAVFALKHRRRAGACHSFAQARVSLLQACTPCV